MTIYTMHPVNSEHLADVIETMKALGSPEIKACFDGEAYWALEGSHRIAAAHALGLVPVIIEVDPEDVIFNADIESNDLRPGGYYTAQEIYDSSYGGPYATPTQYFFSTGDEYDA